MRGCSALREIGLAIAVRMRLLGIRGQNNAKVSWVFSARTDVRGLLGGPTGCGWVAVAVGDGGGREMEVSVVHKERIKTGVMT